MTDTSPEAVRVCAAGDLTNGGLGVKVPIRDRLGETTAFFIRYQDRVYGYVNRCAHVGVELDWENSFFTRAGDLIMCARHGATYAPDTGLCVGGPCRNGKLKALSVQEHGEAADQAVFWVPTDGMVPRG